MNLLPPVRHFSRSFALIKSSQIIAAVSSKSIEVHKNVVHNYYFPNISSTKYFFTAPCTTTLALSQIRFYSAGSKGVINDKPENANKVRLSEIYREKKVTPDVPDKDDEVKVDSIDDKSMGLFKRFKKMYKEYWYVLLPVHIVTSAVWLGGFYYISQSGVDIPSMMESMGISENYINPIRNSKLGHVAVAYLCYKVATPLRYMVTLGGTTVSIKYLVKGGHIRPVLTKEQFLQKYRDRRDAKRN